jgi:hypothetical protein
MILNDKIEVIVNNQLIKYYKDLGYSGVLYRQPLLINVLDLPKGSHVKVDVECNICGVIKKYEFRGIKLTDKNVYHCKKCINRIPSVYTDESKEQMIKKCKSIIQNKLKENPNYLIERNIKTKETKKIKYGSETYNNQNKKRESVLLKYGSENYLNIQKKKETCLLKYGNETYNNQEKKKETCLLKYGFEHSNQVEDIFRKIERNGFKVKKYGNSNLYYRGTYELDFLNYCSKNNIEVINPKSIPYTFNGRNKKYYPDFYHEKSNTMIEVKSEYTFNKDLEINLIKEKATREKKYNFLFIIDKKYDEFIKLV